MLGGSIHLPTLLPLIWKVKQEVCCLLRQTHWTTACAIKCAVQTEPAWHDFGMRIKYQFSFLLPSRWRSVKREAFLSKKSALRQLQSFDRWLINNAGRPDHYTSPCAQNHHVEQRFLRFTNALTYIPNCTFSRREQWGNLIHTVFILHKASPCILFSPFYIINQHNIYHWADAD